MSNIRCFIAAVAVLIAIDVRAALIPLPDEKEHVLSLDGPWRFKLEQAISPTSRPVKMGFLPKPDYPEQVEPFYRLDYTEDQKWHDLNVPGNWEMAGYSVATWEQPDNSFSWAADE